MSTYLAGSAPGGRPRHRAAAHHLPPDGGGHRPPVVQRPNLQNIPVRTALGAQIRQCFTAEPGNLLVVADYSQIELRIMAYLSGEPALLEAFARGRGHPHAHGGRGLRCGSRRRSTQTHRRYAKAVNFGIMYGISAFGLSQNLGIDREEAAAYIERYFERMPRVKAFIEDTIETARRQGYVATVFGRRRPIPELASGNSPGALAGGEAGGQLGHPGQRRRHHQGGHDPLPRAAPARVPGSRLVLQVHDELVFEAPGGRRRRGPGGDGGGDGRRLSRWNRLSVSTRGVGPDWLAAK